MLDEWVRNFVAKFPTIVLALFAMSLLAFAPASSVSASSHDTELPIGWEMGISYIDDDEDKPFLLGEDGGVRVEFWVRNDNLVGEITVAISYDNELAGSVTGPEEVSVSSSSNDTFNADIKDVLVWEKDGNEIGVFEVRGELISWGSAPAVLPSIQNVEANLKVPHLYRLSVEFEEIDHPVNAGTSITYTVGVSNIGNSNDSITDVTLSDDCPLLSHDDTYGSPLDSLIGNQLRPEPNVEHSAELVFDISASHPGRICSIEITIVSNGADGGGLGDRTASDETQLSIEAGRIGSDQDNDDAGIGGDDGPNDPDEVVSSNFMPVASLLAPASIIAVAIARRPK